MCGGGWRSCWVRFSSGIKSKVYLSLQDTEVDLGKHKKDGGRPGRSSVEGAWVRGSDEGDVEEVGVKGAGGGKSLQKQR